MNAIPPLIELLRAGWPLLDDPVPVALLGGGFSGALVVHVRDGQRDLVLRRWPADGPPQPRLRELHRWLRWLSKQGLPVAVPVSGRSREPLIQWGGFTWQLEPLLGGRADDGPASPLQRLQNAMASLARLHAAAERFEPSAGACEWFERRPVAVPPALEERLERLWSWRPDRLNGLQLALSRLPDGANLTGLAEETLSLIRASVPVALAELQAAAGFRAPAIACWRDLWRAHVLFDGDEVTGFIDAAMARVDYFGIDLARYLGTSLPGPGGTWEQALDAYAELRPLSHEDRRIIRILDRSGVILAALRWIMRIAERCVTVDQQDAVRARLAHLRQRLEG